MRREIRDAGPFFCPEFPVVGIEETKILIAALVAINVAYLLSHPGTPSIRSSGVRFKREKRDRYYSIRFLIRRKRGDCEDLVAADVAERIVAGEECWFDVIPAGTTKDGGPNFHVVLTFPGGQRHDTAVELGA